MFVNYQSPVQNDLLATLPGAVYERLSPHLELISLNLGDTIYEAGAPQLFVYFPISGIVSKLYQLEDGTSAEVAVVGKEGMIGVALVLGGVSTSTRAVVQAAGYAYRLLAKQFKSEMDRHTELQRLMLVYGQALFAQMAQTAVCNRHHTIDQQLCRWLLMSMDRLDSHTIAMTQNLISHMLGVRREGVTAAAAKLHKAGLIDYSRGRITVTDRPGLEARVCECYSAVKAEYARLLPQNHLS